VIVHEASAAGRAAVANVCRRRVAAQAADRRELSRLARERIKQAERLGSVAQKQLEALGGRSEHAVVTEFRNVHLDALAGGDVQEVATTAGVGVGGGASESESESELLPLPEEHDPPPGVEAAILQDSVRARVSAAPPPRAAHGSEADVIGHVGGEEALRDQTRGPLVKIRPVSPAEGGA